MATEFRGKIELDIRDSEPDWGPYAAPTAPEDRPTFCTWCGTTPASRHGIASGVLSKCRP